KPLSAPEFRPLFRHMAEHDLPVWIHPIRGPQFADYASEKVSENEIWFTFGWPYETTACVTRLIFSGLYDELPGLKIITHHMGGWCRSTRARSISGSTRSSMEGRPRTPWRAGPV